MPKMYVSNKDETIRLFKNPVLEYFSHIHPITPVIVYVPVAGYLLYLGFSQINILYGLLCILAGGFIWTIFEYAFHRWAFHYHPKSETGKKVHFLVHGIHHDYPRDSTRLVMPLLVSIPLAVLFYFIFTSLFGAYGYNIFAGFIFGYVAYDSVHYATHHMRMNGKIGKFLKEYHLRHHFQDDHTAYGVSNPLWDYVFGTTPKVMKKRSEDEKPEKVVVGN
ncbi:MAG: sterol desaturase family protein [Ignavibacteriae bacterium]|nr:sterol desaturase family protein [Ignavibacteriota bacterium]MCB0723841.1 sterol desaturase family protein [Ignavibacteriota bacterium]MCB9244114.1 sterol desaturase family protein [Ignavibacteriales bacterium]